MHGRLAALVATSMPIYSRRLPLLLLFTFLYFDGAAALPAPDFMSIDGRQLLQGDAPNSTLPNWFNLPVCSRHGSHPMTVLRTLPRARPGIITFGPQNLREREFHPMSSEYMEPVIVLMVPGIVISAMFMCCCCCFCYRRYRLGLCGEPIPTVTAYTPKEIAITMSTTVFTFLAIGLCAWLAVLVANASYEAGFEDLVSAGFKAENQLNNSFRAGDVLLRDAYDVRTALDSFEDIIETRVNTQSLSTNLDCSISLLANLPDGTIMLETAGALGTARGSVPSTAVTDSLFADLRRPQLQYPVLVPPLVEAITNLRERKTALPQLPALAERLDMLNASVLNTSYVPTQIRNALVSVNSTLYALPNLTLTEERLSIVSHEQTGDTSHICSNIPPGWQPGDVTECDLLRQQLRETRDALLSTDAETPLALFDSYEALAAEFPPLPLVVEALVIERRELEACPNLTKLEFDYKALERIKLMWDPTSIGNAIGSVEGAGQALLASQAQRLIPELTTLSNALAPLTCVSDVLTMLTAVNQTLLTLTPSVEQFFQRSDTLGRALRAIPSPLDFISALQGLASALAALPSLSEYTTGVGGISVGLGAMPPTNTLLDGIEKVDATLTLPPTHESVVNVSRALHAAMSSLPAIGPFRSSLQTINASRAELPPLITRALNAIERYDTNGDTSELAVVDETRLAVAALNRAMAARPDEEVLRSGLTAIDEELSRMPATQPARIQIESLDGALQQLPDLNTYLTGLGGLLDATALAPSVDALDGAWSTLTTSLLSVPSFTVTEAPLTSYSEEQAQLPNPPTALLDGTAHLAGLLTAVPQLVASGKERVQQTHDDTREAMNTMLTALFGPDLSGYVVQLQDMQTMIEWSWWIFLASTFGIPVCVTFISVISCITRTGRPALHAGHILMTLLPWYTLLGASIEMPLTMMLQDACDEVPYLANRLTGFLATGGYPEFSSLKEPLYGWVTGCPDYDVMATYFTPIVNATQNATYATTRDLSELELLPVARAGVDFLTQEALDVANKAVEVHDMLACSRIHEMYLEVHTAVCCDVAYAFTAQWATRLVTCWMILACLIASIAGYKRFRRQKDLWGPYATIEALKVGSYL